MGNKLKTETGREAFRRTYGPWALVAGASEGIGRSFVEQLAACGIHIILVARREGPLNETARHLEETYGVSTVVVTADLSEPDVGEQLGEYASGYEIGMFVYNAAFSELGEFMDTSEQSKLLMIDVNCRAPVLLLPHFIEPMRKRGRGGIVIMSSMSAFQGGAMVSTYAASKSFGQILGEGLWEELKPYGVDVIVCAAGATRTPSFDNDTPVEKRWRGMPMKADGVARRALDQIGHGGPLTIPGAMNRVAGAVLQRVVSRRSAVKFFSSTTRGMYEE